jgi:hypothetical protein
VVLLADCPGCTVEPSLMVMWWIVGGRVGGMCQGRIAICTGIGAKIIVEGMIFLDDNDNVLNGISRFQSSSLFNIVTICYKSKSLMEEIFEIITRENVKHIKFNWCIRE